MAFVEWADTLRNRNGTEYPIATYDNFAALMNGSKFHFYYDEILKRIVPPESITHVSSLQAQPQALLDSCRDSLERNGIKADARRVSGWIMKYADDCRRNPVKEHLQWLLPAFEPVGMKHLFSCLKTTGDRERHYKMLVKWLVQACAMAYNTGSYGADFVLVLQGGQGCGKTTFFRTLAKPFPEYYKEGASLSADNKDSLMESTRYWITELGELERTTNREMGWLKAFLTNAADEYRPPYGASAVKHPRNTCFCATVNDDTFLREAGRRFYVIPVEDIDLDELRRVDIEHVWAEAHQIYLENHDFFRLDKQEIAEITEYSKQFVLKNDEEATLLDVFDFDAPEGQWNWLTATKISQLAGLRSPARTGKALAALGYAKENDERPVKRAKGTNFYLVPPIDQNRTEYAVRAIENTQKVAGGWR